MKEEMAAEDKKERLTYTDGIAARCLTGGIKQLNAADISFLVDAGYLALNEQGRTAAMFHLRNHLERLTSEHREIATQIRKFSRS